LICTIEPLTPNSANFEQICPPSWRSSAGSYVPRSDAGSSNELGGTR
jgi:hypothetical protein